MYNIGDKYTDGHDLGTIENFNGVPMLIVKRGDKVVKTIVVRKIKDSKFKRVEDD